MRLVTYANGAQVGVGVQAGDAVLFTGYVDMLELVRDGERGLERAAAALEDPRPVAFDRLLAPLPRPGTIFGIGVNYASHGEENPNFVPPDEPAVDFVKLPSAVIGPGAPIVIPATDGVIARPDGFDVDYEVELGVVFGRRARGVDRQHALEHVFGFTLFNDVGARAVQFRNRQVDLAKGFDTFAPMGPCLVTRDELPDLGRIHLQSVVNGEIRQDAYVEEMINPVPALIEWITSVVTCEPGDCLSTGTPAGCGTFRDPPAYLHPGDVVTVREDSIGELTNPVVAG